MLTSMFRKAMSMIEDILQGGSSSSGTYTDTIAGGSSSSSTSFSDIFDGGSS